MRTGRRRRRRCGGRAARVTAYGQRYGAVRRTRAGRRARHVHGVRRHGVPAARADHAGARRPCGTRSRTSGSTASSATTSGTRRGSTSRSRRWVEHDLSGFPDCPSPPVPRRSPGVFLDSTMDVFDRRSEPVRTRRLQRRRLRARGGGRRDRPHRVPRPAEVVRRGPPLQRRAGPPISSPRCAPRRRRASTSTPGRRVRVSAWAEATLRPAWPTTSVPTARTAASTLTVSRVSRTRPSVAAAAASASCSRCSTTTTPTPTPACWRATAAAASSRPAAACSS